MGMLLIDWASLLLQFSLSSLAATQSSEPRSSHSKCRDSSRRRRIEISRSQTLKLKPEAIGAFSTNNLHKCKPYSLSVSYATDYGDLLILGPLDTAIV